LGNIENLTSNYKPIILTAGESTRIIQKLNTIDQTHFIVRNSVTCLYRDDFEKSLVLTL